MFLNKTSYSSKSFPSNIIRPITNSLRRKHVFCALSEAGLSWRCCLASTSTRPIELGNPGLMEVWAEPLWAPDRPIRSQRCDCRQLDGWAIMSLPGTWQSRPRQMSKRMSVVWEEDQRRRPGAVGGPKLPFFVSLSPTLSLPTLNSNVFRYLCLSVSQASSLASKKIFSSFSLMCFYLLLFFSLHLIGVHTIL